MLLLRSFCMMCGLGGSIPANGKRYGRYFEVVRNGDVIYLITATPAPPNDKKERKREPQCNYLAYFT